MKLFFKAKEKESVQRNSLENEEVRKKLANEGIRSQRQKKKKNSNNTPEEKKWN